MFRVAAAPANFGADAQNLKVEQCLGLFTASNSHKTTLCAVMSLAGVQNRDFTRGFTARPERGRTLVNDSFDWE
jgi:hypothetical protein